MTWATGFAAYLRSYEVRVHRRLDTWGGKTWADNTPGLIGPQAQLRIAMNAMEARAS